jgi:ABC-2 type transport system ATP-binding protein
MTSVEATNPARVAPPASPRATVALHGVSVFYGEVIGLSRVDLELQPGITGIVGPNGSGKTTLMRTLVGLISPHEGRAEVLGASPFADAAIRSRITFVPATENFYPGLSGRKNLEVAFLARGKRRSEARALADRALDVIDLRADGHRRYGTWSRGMRQRLKLGLALTSEPDLVLLDEPFLGVDPPNRRALRDHILELARHGRTVLVSSHVLHEIESLTDRVGVLARGRLLGFGNIENLLDQIRDSHPHRVQVHVDDPRVLGKALLELPHVRELTIVGSEGVEFITDHPEVAYRDLAKLVVQSGVVVRRVEPLHATLEDVFTHVTEVGIRRL